MAKININGQTVSDNAIKKNSAKKTAKAMSGIINTLSGSMDAKTRDNAQTIASIINMV